MEKKENITGLVSVSFRKLPPEKIVECAKKSGLKFIEWGSDVHVPENDPKNAEKVAELTKNSGLSVSSYGSYYRLGEGQDFNEYLNIAKILNSPVIRIWAGTKTMNEINDEIFENMVSETKEISRHASKEGIIVCFEFHPHTLTDDYESALKLLEAVDEPNCRIYWQPDYRISTEDNIKALKAIISYVDIIHVFNWNEKTERFPLEEGIEVWKKYYDAAKEKDIKYLLEFVKDDNEEILPVEAESLRKILN